MATDAYHEVIEPLTEQTQNAHRAIVSLMEELQAIDSYTQRAEACSDTQLKDVLLHNRDEEVEHAAMLMEWIRRHDEHFNTMMRTYLFTEQPITRIEKGAGSGGPGSSTAPTLGIGSTRGR